MGLFLAGFDVVGCDLREQEEYPFEFKHECALGADVSKADFIWASPPCQSFSGIIPAVTREKYGHLWNHQNLIPATREKLRCSGKLYVIENVQGACQELRSPVMLCGTMFPGLKVFRHRLFESNFSLHVDLKCDHRNKSLGFRSPSLSSKHAPLQHIVDDDTDYAEIHIADGEWKRDRVTRKSGQSAGTTDDYYYSPTGTSYRSIKEIERSVGRRVKIFEKNQPVKTSHAYTRRSLDSMRSVDGVTGMFPIYGSPGTRRGTIEEWSDAMQIHWITCGKTLAQAIPPAYSEYIGRQALLKLGYTLDYPPRCM